MLLILKILKLQLSHGCHHQIEFFVINLSVSIDVYVIDETFYLLLIQFLAQVHHDSPKLTTTDESVAVLEGKTDF